MADILIKGMEMPSEGRIINLTICSDGSVINNLPDAGGKMSSYRSERVKAVALPSHGDLIDRGLVQEVLAQLLPLVITNELTDKEIGLVHRTVGAIAEMINEQEVVVEATE